MRRGGYEEREERKFITLEVYTDQAKERVAKQSTVLLTSLRITGRRGRAF